MDKCQVKGCNNTAAFSLIEHDGGDHEICTDCVNKHTRQTDITHGGPCVKDVIEDRIKHIRQKIVVAKDAKKLGQTDLYQYSVQSAEQLIIEIEGFIND